jgi:hypothetical protein
MKVGFWKRWALYRQKAIHQVLLLFTVKAVPVFTAKLLAIDFAIESFWLKLPRESHLANHSITVLTPKRLHFGDVYWNSRNNNMVLICFLKTKPVLTSESFNSSISSISTEEEQIKGNNNCWLEAWLTVMFVKIAHTKPADVHAVGLQ